MRPAGAAAGSQVTLTSRNGGLPGGRLPNGIVLEGDEVSKRLLLTAGPTRVTLAQFPGDRNLFSAYGCRYVELPSGRFVLVFSHCVFRISGRGMPHVAFGNQAEGAWQAQALCRPRPMRIQRRHA